MTYAEAVSRLLALRGGEHAGMQPGLERIEALLDALGRPEQRYDLVQVAGTNGKGSVSSLLATMLRSAGRRVGLYTSPHLCSFRERIRVDGVPISPDAVADGVDALGTLIARTHATMFEATTALALDHFARERVDIAVLEVGLGGRLDATTVGRPVVSVITPVDVDHEAVLGSTLTQIAVEKAAIIRSGVALSAAQAPAVWSVIAERARAQCVPLLLEGRDLHGTVLDRRRDSQRVTLGGPGWLVSDARLTMLGRFQVSNAVLAAGAASCLGVPEAAVRAGLERTRWPGRFQLLGADPTLVLDGAHNPSGARALRQALTEYFPGEPVTVIVGLSRDKDAAGIVGELAPAAARLILTRAAHPRAVDPATLLAAVPASLPATVEVAPTVAEALVRAQSAPGHAVVCVTGSLFLVAEVLALHSTQPAEPDSPCGIEKEADSIGPRV